MTKRHLWTAVLVLIVTGCVGLDQRDAPVRTVLIDAAPEAQSVIWWADDPFSEEIQGRWRPGESTGMQQVRLSPGGFELVWGGFDVDLAHFGQGSDVVYVGSDGEIVGVDGIPSEPAPIVGVRDVNVPSRSVMLLCWGPGIDAVSLAASVSVSMPPVPLPSMGWELRDFEGTSVRAVRVQATQDATRGYAPSSAAFVSVTAISADGSIGTIEVESASGVQRIELRNGTVPSAELAYHRGLLYATSEVTVRADIKGDGSDTQVFVNACPLPAEVAQFVGDEEIWQYSVGRYPPESRPLTPLAAYDGAHPAFTKREWNSLRVFSVPSASSVVISRAHRRGPERTSLGSDRITPRSTTRAWPPPPPHRRRRTRAARWRRARS